MAEEAEVSRDRWMDLFDRMNPVNLLPTESREHALAAQREMLLAFRGLVDEAIRCVEEAEKPRGRRRTKIEVK